MDVFNAMQARQAEIESRLAQKAASVAQQIRYQGPHDDSASGVPLPDTMDGLKEELSACTAAARYSASLQVQPYWHLLNVKITGKLPA